MVIGYNPSHSNVNSEVNAPFKILSTLLRFIENELKPTNKKPLRPVIDIEEEKKVVLRVLSQATESIKKKILQLILATEWIPWEVEIQTRMVDMMMA